MTDIDDAKMRTIERQLCELWNRYRSAGVPKAQPSKKNQDARLRKVRARWKEYSEFETCEKIFKFMSRNPWYSGKNNRGWVANFSWVLTPARFHQLAESSSGVSLSEEDDTAAAIDNVLRRAR